MSMQPGDFPKPQLEMNATDFYARLDPKDLENVNRFFFGLIQTLPKQGIGGAIIGTGDVLTNSMSKNDFQFVVILNDGQLSVGEYDHEEKVLEPFTYSVQSVVERSVDSFQISAIEEPVLEKEHHKVTEERIRDNAHIMIQPKQGNPFELILSQFDNLDEFVLKQGKPFTVLHKFEGKPPPAQPK